MLLWFSVSRQQCAVCHFVCCQGFLSLDSSVLFVALCVARVLCLSTAVCWESERCSAEPTPKRCTTRRSSFTARLLLRHWRRSSGDGHPQSVFNGVGFVGAVSRHSGCTWCGGCSGSDGCVGSVGALDVSVLGFVGMVGAVGVLGV